MDSRVPLMNILNDGIEIIQEVDEEIWNLTKKMQINLIYQELN